MEDNKDCHHGNLHSCASCKDVSCPECQKVWDFRNKRAILPLVFLVVAAAVGAHLSGLIDVVSLLQQLKGSFRPIA
jgi:hypothetical protein